MKAEDWIKVEDRMPEEDVTVLLLSSVRCVAVGCLHKGEWLINNVWRAFRLSAYTHWMPIILPKEDRL